jgi:major membrane immunogen (membrane-anchored lipoprotein)
MEVSKNGNKINFKGEIMKRVYDYPPNLGNTKDEKADNKNKVIERKALEASDNGRCWWIHDFVKNSERYYMGW